MQIPFKRREFDDWSANDQLHRRRGLHARALVRRSKVHTVDGYSASVTTDCTAWVSPPDGVVLHHTLVQDVSLLGGYQSTTRVSSVDAAVWLHERAKLLKLMVTAERSPTQQFICLQRRSNLDGLARGIRNISPTPQMQCWHSSPSTKSYSVEGVVRSRSLNSSCAHCSMDSQIFFRFVVSLEVIARLGSNQTVGFPMSSPVLSCLFIAQTKLNLLDAAERQTPSEQLKS